MINESSAEVEAYVEARTYILPVANTAGLLIPTRWVDIAEAAALGSYLRRNACSAQWADILVMDRHSRRGGFWRKADGLRFAPNTERCIVGLQSRIQSSHIAESIVYDFEPWLEVIEASLELPVSAKAAKRYRLLHDRAMSWLATTSLPGWPKFVRISGKSGQTLLS